MHFLQNFYLNTFYKLAYPYYFTFFCVSHTPHTTHWWINYAINFIQNTEILRYKMFVRSRQRTRQQRACSFNFTPLEVESRKTCVKNVDVRRAQNQWKNVFQKQLKLIWKDTTYTRIALLLYSGKHFTRTWMKRFIQCNHVNKY